MIDCALWPYGSVGGGMVMVRLPLAKTGAQRIRLLPSGAIDDLMAGTPELGAVAVLNPAGVIAKTAEYIRHFAPHGIPLCFPYPTDDVDEVIPVAGRISEFEADEAGINGLVHWTPRGASHITQRAFSCIGAIVAHSRTGAVENILSVVLIPDLRPHEFAEPARVPA